MSDLMMASSEADARAGESVVAHRAEMSSTLAAYVDRLSVAARNGAADEAGRTRDDLLEWCRTGLVPYALAEEATLYPAGVERVESRLLVTSMLAEHRVILSLVDDLADAGDHVSATAVAAALQVIFESHLSLLAQIQQRHPDTFDVDYLERGPEAWRLAIVRRSA